MLERVINELEFKHLNGLDLKYNQIKVSFDDTFEQRVSQLVKIVNWKQPKFESSFNKTNELSTELTNADSSLILPTTL